MVERSDPAAPDDYLVADSDRLTRTLRFADGEELSIVFRDPFPDPPVDYKPENLAHSYDELATKAENGDAFAATVLYRTTSDCNAMYYRDEGQLQELRDDIAQTQSFKMIDRTNGEVSISYADADGVVLSALEKSFEICRWLTSDMRENTAHWQRLASENGNPRQMHDYVLTQLGNTAKGRDILTSAFMQGYYDAGTTLGSFLIGQRVPIVEEDGPGAIDERQSRIDGFAYYYLAVTIGHADPAMSGSPRMRESIHNQFNQAVSHMSVAEQDEGVQRAKEILAGHPNCCELARPIRDNAQKESL